MALPPKGMSSGDVMAALKGMKAGDHDWHAGRTFSLVYFADDEVEELAAEAAVLYLSENALNVDVFPSLRVMQQDVLSIASDLLHGGDSAAGFMTSGGTESILMAVKAARDWARAERGIAHPSMVLPTSAHAAYAKAAHYFDVAAIWVPVDEGFRADPAVMANAMRDDTALLVCSAPTYPQGVVDPVPEIATLAADAGVLCHVDACMGSFILPFLERLGRWSGGPWDFRVPGVTSISADIHKYGYAPKGASVVMYRTRELRRHQAFMFDAWLGGAYGSPSMPGTRPAGPIAMAWAVLHHLGEDGYLRLAAEAHDGALALIDGVAGIDGLRIVGEPEATLVAIAAEDDAGIDAFGVGDVLRSDGWYLDRQTPPDSLHATVHAGNAPSVPQLVEDLRTAAAAAPRTGSRDTTYGTVE